MDKKEALKLIAEIETLSQGFGEPNSNALRKINSNLFALRSGNGTRDGYLYFDGKLDSIAGYSEIGFSTRKFEKYAGGARQIRVFVLGDCSVLKSLINEWKDL